MMYHKTFPSPIGLMSLQASDRGMTAISFTDTGRHRPAEQTNDFLEVCCLQLTDYFAGSRYQFDVPIAPVGTPFQQQVWQLVLQIPFGTTVSYHALAECYGDVKAIRALAAANGKNKLALLIPCHRVVGSNGALTGFAWGLERKRWLLDHEAGLSGKTVQACLF